LETAGIFYTLLWLPKSTHYNSRHQPSALVKYVAKCSGSMYFVTYTHVLAWTNTTKDRTSEEFKMTELDQE